MTYKYELEDRLDAQLWNYNSLKEAATYVVRLNYASGKHLGGTRRYGVDRITKSTRLSGSAFDTPLQALQYIRMKQEEDIREGKVL